MSKKDKDKVLYEFNIDFNKINDMLDAGNRYAYADKKSNTTDIDSLSASMWGIPISHSINDKKSNAIKDWNETMPKFEEMYQRVKHRNQLPEKPDIVVAPAIDNTHAVVQQKPQGRTFDERIDTFNKNNRGLKLDRDFNLYIGDKKFRKILPKEPGIDDIITEGGGGIYDPDTGEIVAIGFDSESVNHEASHALDFEYIPKGAKIDNFKKMRDMFYKQTSQLEPHSSWKDVGFGFDDYMDKPSERYARWGERGIFDDIASRPRTYIDSAASAIPNMMYRDNDITPEYLDSLVKSTDDIYRTLTAKGMQNLYNNNQLYPTFPDVVKDPSKLIKFLEK